MVVEEGDATNTNVPLTANVWRTGLVIGANAIEVSDVIITALYRYIASTTIYTLIFLIV